MPVQIISVPYASGKFEFRTGRGPGHLLENGLATSLADAGADIDQVQTLTLAPDKDTEVEALFSLHGNVSVVVERTIRAGDFPLVLAGNCSSTVGIVSGQEKDGLGVIWFDAHGDYNTPETTMSGHLDGMALSVLTGQCWQRMAEQIPGYAPIEESRVLHIGGRCFDEEEHILMYGSDMHLLENGDLQRRGITPMLAEGLRWLSEAGVERVHLHFDLDVLDPEEAPANFHENSSGLSVAQAIEAIQMIRDYFPLTSAALTAYDPEYDPENRTVEAAKRIATTLATPST